MKMNLDLSAVKAESSGFDDLIPEGEYVAAFSGADLITTKAGGTGLKLTLRIVNGECEGKQISDFLNIKNANPKAEQIAMSRLRKICELTLNVPTLKDTDQLMGKRVTVKVEQEMRAEYMHNKIKAYTEASNSVASVAPVGDKYQAKESPVLAKSNPWD